MAVQIIGPSGYIANVDSNNNLYVTLAQSDIGGLAMVGTLTHNSAAPIANNIGVLPAVASTSVPTYTAGDQVLLSTDLSGNLRITGTLAFPATPIIYLEGHAGGVMDAVQGATAAANSLSVGGTYTSSLPTLTTGQQTAIQLDAKGQQLFDLNYVLGALHSKTNPIFALPTDGTNQMGLMTVFGTTPGAVYALPTNSSLFIGTVAATSSQISGALAVGGAVATATALTSATYPLLIAGSDYGGTPKIQNMKVDSGGATYSNSKIWDGTTVALVIAGTNALKTDLSSVAGTATSTAAAGVAKVGITGNAAATLDIAQGGGTAATNALQIAGVFNTSLPTLTNGQGGAIQLDAKGQQLFDLNYVLGALNSVTNGLFVVCGDNTRSMTVKAASTASVAADTSVVVQLSPNQPQLTTPLNTSSVPTTTGGCSTAVSQALTTTVNVKASAGQIYGYTISNPNAAPIYVEYYNTATTPGTIGATTNLVLEIMIPAGATANMEWSNGIPCSSGIAVAVATTATGAVAPGIGATITTIYK